MFEQNSVFDSQQFQSMKSTIMFERGRNSIDRFADSRLSQHGMPIDYDVVSNVNSKCAN